MEVMPDDNIVVLAQFLGCSVHLLFYRQKRFRIIFLICVIGLPHGLVFPKCAAVVHHGGAGTSQAATLAGVSSIVVAHIAEQKSWGAELKRIGVAPGILVRKNLTNKTLANKIKIVLGSLEMQERAKEIGKSMRKEDGVRKAVELINEKFKT